MKELAEALKARAGLRMRQGVVTATSGATCSVLIGGSDVAVDGVQHLNSCAPAPGDVVWITSDGADLWIIGTHGDPPPIDPSRLPAFATYFTEADPAGNPETPTGVAVTAMLTGLLVKWDLPPEALWRTWEVQVSAAADFSGPTTYATDQIVSTLPFEPGAGPLYVRVRALNARGEFSAWAEAAGNPFAIPPSPELELGPGSVHAEHMAALAVDLASNVVTGQLTAAKLAEGAVTLGKLDVEVSGAIDAAASAASLADAAADAAQAAADSAMTEAQTGTIAGARIVAGSVLAAKLDVVDVQAAVVTAAKVNALSLDAAAVKAGTLDVARLAAGSITAAKLDVTDVQAAVVTAAKVNALALSADAIVAGTLSAARIAAGSIDAAKLNVSDVQAAVVTAAKVNTLALNASVIAAGTIATARLDVAAILASEITAANITGGSVSGVTLTGAVIRTTPTAAGKRIQLDTSHVLAFYSGDAGETNPGRITAYTYSGGGGYMSLSGPTVSGQPMSSYISLHGAASRKDILFISHGGASMTLGPATKPASLQLSGDLDMTSNTINAGAGVIGGVTLSGADASGIDQLSANRFYTTANCASGVSADGVWINDLTTPARRWKLYMNNGQLYARYDSSGSGYKVIGP
jgi:hypothetical protein